ncbi:MAG: hypothetical protein J7539_17485 [Niabella sp.]|nr:hypothetical protein [Niabella sp.]
MKQQIFKFIITYKNPTSASLWINKKDTWFNYFFDDRDASDEIKTNFRRLKIEYNDLPESLRALLEKDNWIETIKVIYSL